MGFLYVFCNLTAVQAGALGIIGMICANNLSITVTGSGVEGPWQILMSVILILFLGVANSLGASRFERHSSPPAA